MYYTKIETYNDEDHLISLICPSFTWYWNSSSSAEVCIYYYQLYLIHILVCNSWMARWNWEETLHWWSTRVANGILETSSSYKSIPRTKHNSPMSNKWPQTSSIMNTTSIMTNYGQAPSSLFDRPSHVWETWFGLPSSAMQGGNWPPHHDSYRCNGNTCQVHVFHLIFGSYRHGHTYQDDVYDWSLVIELEHVASHELSFLKLHPKEYLVDFPRF